VLLQDVAALRQVCADGVGQIEELNARLQEAKRRRLEEVGQLQEHVDGALREHVMGHAELPQGWLCSILDSWGSQDQKNGSDSNV